MRIEPPPSVAWAAGTTPAATAAAAPPELPPEERLRSHGLRVGRAPVGSVVGAGAGGSVVGASSDTGTRTVCPDVVSTVVYSTAGRTSR